MSRRNTGRLNRIEERLRIDGTDDKHLIELIQMCRRKTARGMRMYGLNPTPKMVDESRIQSLEKVRDRSQDYSPGHAAMLQKQIDLIHELPWPEGVLDE